MIPCSLCSGERSETLYKAPRILYAPVNCMFSGLNQTLFPVCLLKKGLNTKPVSRMTFRSTASAALNFSNVSIDSRFYLKTNSAAIVKDPLEICSFLVGGKLVSFTGIMPPEIRHVSISFVSFSVVFATRLYRLGKACRLARVTFRTRSKNILANSARRRYRIQPSTARYQSLYHIRLFRKLSDGY